MNPELLQRWWTPLLSLAGGFLVGFLLEKIVVKKLRKLSARTPWEWDNIFAETLSGFPFIWCLLAGVYGMALTATVSADHLKKIEKLLLVVSIVSVTVFVARLSARLAEFYSRKDHGVFPSATILTHLTRVFIYIVGLLTIFYTFGINITPALTALGIGGIAVALALQDTLSNFFAGLQIIASKQISTGDYIKITSGEEGFVTDITWRNTTLLGQPNNTIVIPNAKLATNIFTNFDLPEKEIAVTTQLGVAYNSDLQRVEDIALEIATGVMKEVRGGVPEFEPVVRFLSFADSNILLSVTMRARDFNSLPLVRHEFVKRLHARFRKENIDIPYSIRPILINEKSNE